MGKGRSGSHKLFLLGRVELWVGETKIPHGVHDRSLEHEPHDDIDAAIGIVIMESRN